MDIKIIQLIKLGFYLMCSVVMISCETIGYYSQAAQGQLGLILQRQNIDELVSARNIPEDLKHKFEDIERIKNFAEVNLGLPVGDNYSSYVDVERDYLVWNVFAAPELSLIHI